MDILRVENRGNFLLPWIFVIRKIEVEKTQRWNKRDATAGEALRPFGDRRSLAFDCSVLRRRR